MPLSKKRNRERMRAFRATYVQPKPSPVQPKPISPVRPMSPVQPSATYVQPARPFSPAPKPNVKPVRPPVVSGAVYPLDPALVIRKGV